MKYSSLVGSAAVLIPAFGEFPERHTPKEGSRGGDVPAVGMSMASEPKAEAGSSDGRVPPERWDQGAEGEV